MDVYALGSGPTTREIALAKRDPNSREAVPSQSPVLHAARRATLGSVCPRTFVNPNGAPHQATSACETPSGFCGGGGCGIPSVAHACRRADTGLWDGTPSGFDVGGGCRVDAYARGSGPTSCEIAPATREPHNREAVPSQSPVLLAARRATLGSVCPNTFVKTPTGFHIMPSWRVKPLRGFVVVGLRDTQRGARLSAC